MQNQSPKNIAAHEGLTNWSDVAFLQCEIDRESEFESS